MTRYAGPVHIFVKEDLNWFNSMPGVILIHGLALLTNVFINRQISIISMDPYSNVLISQMLIDSFSSLLFMPLWHLIICFRYMLARYYFVSVVPNCHYATLRLWFSNAFIILFPNFAIASHKYIWPRTISKNTTLWCERICEKYDVHKFPSKQKINISLKKKRPHRQGTNM